MHQYIGDPEYRNLSVVDNLELYFREQVFGPDRPSGNSPYIQVVSSNSSAATSSDRSGSSVVFVAEPPYAERFIALFSERIIDITAEARTSASNGAASRGGEATISPTQSAADVNSTFMNRQRSGSQANQPTNEYVVPETRALLILSDLNLYMVTQDSFSSSQLFGDAPVPVLINSHPIYALRLE